MALRTIAYIILCCSIFAHTFAATSSIHACHEEYANKTFTLYSYTDLITKTEEVIATITVDSLGCFTTEIELNATKEVYLYAGAYKLFLYVQPNQHYTIALPPYSEKTLAEELNPYFEYESMSLGIIDSTENYSTHTLIQLFDREYEDFVQEYYLYLFTTRDKHCVDSFETKIDSLFGKYDANTYFREYKNYQIYALRHMAYQRDNIAMTRRHFTHQPYYPHNTAYMNFFYSMWKGYIVNNYMRGMGKDITQAILYGKSPQMFKELLEKQIAFRNDTIKELLLLICLDDCLANPQTFYIAPVVQTLDSLVLTSTIPEHITIAENIKKKRCQRIEGESSPEFALYDSDSTLHTITDFKGKYVYLSFCRSENFACIQDYKILQKMNEKTYKELAIISINYEKDFSTFKKFCSLNPQYSWTFLYAADNPEIASYFNIKGMPSYILLNREGIIEIADAPTPLDNFQETFADVIKTERKNKSEAEKRKKLYDSW